ncbi:Xaa-Pro dipeptidase [Marinobacter sp. VGCF2001]|uniref:Xaa-Pro dipeptidase n=1 Tax=Marinobacter sp. VGCF2001 TaxID=3417189 RepID=UPI003CFB9CB8
MPKPTIPALQPDHIRELQARYERALADNGYDSLLIASGAAPYRYRDDQAYVFQGFGPFLHWTGLAGQEHSWLLIRPGQTPVLWLYQPVDFWHANPELAEEPWQQVIEVRSRQQTSAPALEECGKLAVMGDPLVLEGVPGDHNPAALVAAVEETRVLKTPYEIECLAHANQIALAGHAAAREAFLAGESEFGINLAYQQATGQREAEAPYHSIIGLNEHAGTLHYQYYEVTPPGKPRSLLIDAGVRYRGYCSDITRTTAGVDDPKFAALVHGLDALQVRLCNMVAPGVDYVDIHRKAHQGIAALLSSSGLVSGLADDAIVERGITRVFFPHGIGHFLGIQVHDVAGKPTPAPADAPFLRLTRRLEEGMVVTIEPGLYFIPSLLEPLLSGADAQYVDTALLDELKGCGGIRIEDNVVVTATGARNLTRER